MVTPGTQGCTARQRATWVTAAIAGDIMAAADDGRNADDADGSNDAGSVTVEAAMALAVLAVVLVACLAGVACAQNRSASSRAALGALRRLLRDRLGVDDGGGDREQLGADVDDPAEEACAARASPASGPSRRTSSGRACASSARRSAGARQVAELVVARGLVPSPTTSFGSHLA